MLGASQTSEINGTSRRHTRVALVVKEPSERSALLEVLQRDPNIEAIILENVQALSSSDLDGMDAVIVSHQALARLKGADTLGFVKLGRGARVIIALNSDELLEASGTMGHADGWIFVDVNVSHLPQVIELSKQGYSIMPGPVIERLAANKLRIAEYDRLPELEKQVIDLIAEGYGNHEIAERLGLSGAHTKALVKSGLTRLHFQNRTQAAVFIARQIRPHLATQS